MFNPGKDNQLPICFEGIVKLYEHCWWAGIKLPPSLTARNAIPTYVISEVKAKECASKLRERYPYLEEVCLVLDNGETWIQSAD